MLISSISSLYIISRNHRLTSGPINIATNISESKIKNKCWGKETEELTLQAF